MSQTDETLQKVKQLIQAYKNGSLGGETMPEDSKPLLSRISEENAIYLTLPMSLNYQRNSYKLWEAALQTWNDNQTHFVFEPKQVVSRPKEDLASALVKYKLALQPNKQPQIWFKLCETITNDYNGNISNLLIEQEYDIQKILHTIQILKKSSFPYLSGIKIASYWLYVLTQYTDFSFTNRKLLSIAPDTHICQASIMLGITELTDTPSIVADKWDKLLSNTEFDPIDVHTPLWLWSRSGFKFRLGK